MDILNLMKYGATAAIILISLHILYTIGYACRLQKKALNK